MTPTFFRKINIRSNHFNKFIKHPDFLFVYKNYRNELNTKMTRARNKYYKSLFSEETLGRCGEWWKTLNIFYSHANKLT